MNKIKQRLSILLITILGLVHSAKGQSDLTFYHLGEITPQSSIYNPVFFPDADFYISLPVISGVSTNFNNSISYDDVFASIDGTDSVEFSSNKLLSNLKDGDRMSFDGSVTLLQVGFHIGRTSALQVFVNERVKSRLYYPKQLMEYLLNGNGEYLGQEVEENNLRGQGTYYREYGVGYTHQLMIGGSKKLRIGMKLKYLQGFVQAEVDEDASIRLMTDEDNYSVTVSSNQAVLRTAGIESMDNASYLMSNDNTGYGMDIGADFQISPKLNVALAVNDIGSITWKEEVVNYELMESEATFGGLDLSDFDDIGESLKDTLTQLFDYNEIREGSFKSKLNTRVFVSGSYQVIPKGTVTGTIMTRNDLGSQSFTYGIGYTHKVSRLLTVSTTVSRKPKQGIAVGGGFAARLGIVQLYTSVDNTIGFNDVRNMQNLNVRVGINLLFGRRSEKKIQKDDLSNEIDYQPKEKKSKKKFSPFPDEYDLDHLEEID
ncbi:MAG: DUF5723 family protein [Reichenbachiella sp.]|uniref:DUF5723 family protein n=1 Tax=Reichenbachiella sp. TaxID=2184521 RepID=UPI003296F0E9